MINLLDFSKCIILTQVGFKLPVESFKRQFNTNMEHQRKVHMKNYQCKKRNMVFNLLFSQNIKLNK